MVLPSKVEGCKFRLGKVACFPTRFSDKRGPAPGVDNNRTGNPERRSALHADLRILFARHVHESKAAKTLYGFDFQIE